MPQRLAGVARMRIAAALAAAACRSAIAADSPESPAPHKQLERVSIQGETATDMDTRRGFVAGKLVISRKSIADSGQPNAYEVLKRDPAVTVAADGRLGLLGLPGYTQVLVDGQAPPPGRSPLELDVVMIERIEIVKGALAEYGPFSIAGTINIVTRRAERKQSASLATTGTFSGPTTQARIAWSNSIRPADGAWALSTRVSAMRRAARILRQSVTETAVGPNALAVTDQARTKNHETQSQLNASSSYSLKWSGSTDLETTPSVMFWRTGDDGEEQHDWARGPMRAPESRSVAKGRLALVALPLSWKHRFSGGSGLELAFESSRTSISRHNSRADLYRQPPPGLGAPTTLWGSDSRSRLAVEFLRFQFTPVTAEAHEVKLGGTFRRSRWRDDVDSRVDGMADPALAMFGNSQQRSGPSHTAFIQDEWTITERLAVTAGLSAAWRRVHLQEGTLGGIASYGVYSPSLHVAHKLDEDGKRKLRLSVDRSFQAPDTEQYLQRPIIHPLAPCLPLMGCGPNAIEYADRAGNPNLKPERAMGLTLGYETYFGKAGMVGLDIFQRQLRDVIGQVVGLETVSWSTSARYVIRPDNLGTAWVRGISVDMRLSAADLDATWPRLSVRAGVTLANSRLRTVPGPDNRMADQSPWSAKLGLRYKLTTLPLELSTDANWRPGLWYRTAVDRRLYQGRRQDLSAQAAWAFSPTLTFRATLNNLLSTDVNTVDVYGIGSAEDARISTRKQVGSTVTLTMEARL